MTDIFTKQHLLKALKKAGLPFSYPTLKRYEKAGIIPKPRMVKMSKKSWRVYTQEDLDIIISKMKNHKMS